MCGFFAQYIPRMYIPGNRRCYLLVSGLRTAIHFTTFGNLAQVRSDCGCVVLAVSFHLGKVLKSQQQFKNLDRTHGHADERKPGRQFQMPRIGSETLVRDGV
ncbi:hypothetical protein AX14_012194 [Amanita brunnescens Koide BX004]|nr:hypothetical protein AX14_012194 [Amanita brunnescens Koide BX004]